jgi:16S rRNA (uracil1498-N3)-methyltransferase
MHRFCCPDAVRDGECVRIEGAAAVQIRRVLRLGPGDQIILFGLDEWEYTIRLDMVEREAARGTVVARALPAAEPRCALTLALALLKGEKCEWVLQKGTELGVGRFVLMQTRRTVATPDERRAAGRRERYTRIIREATEQCGRLRPPPVDGILPFEQALAQPADLRLILHEGATRRLREVLGVGDWLSRIGCLPSAPDSRHPIPDTLLLVGPEGGFTEEEVALAVERGAIPVSLGPRILRAETAALAAVTLAIDALDG